MGKGCLHAGTSPWEQWENLARLFRSSQQQLPPPEGRKLWLTEELPGGVGGAEEEENPVAQRRFARWQENTDASPSK